MGHILYGFRKNEQGRIESRLFDSQVLFGEAARQGWVDSPDKLPGAEKMQAREAAEKAAALAKIAEAQAKPPSLPVAPGTYGDYTPKRKPGRPRKNP